MKTKRHSLFSNFDPISIDRDFRRIAAAGLNPVRIFVEAEAYPDKVARLTANDALPKTLHILLGLASSLNLNAILTFEHWLPEEYMRLYVDRRTRSYNDGMGLNSYIFNDAHAELITDLVSATERLGEGLGKASVLWAIDISNELSFFVDHEPVAHAAEWAGGKNDVQFEPKNRAVNLLLEEAVRRYTRRNREALRTAKYPGLLTLSVFPSEYYEGDRYATPSRGVSPRRPVPLQSFDGTSGPNFMSINLYPNPRNPNGGVKKLMHDLGLHPTECRCKSLPVLITEMGHTQDYFAGMTSKLRLSYFLDSVRAACHYGKIGWLHWN